MVIHGKEGIQKFSEGDTIGIKGISSDLALDIFELDGNPLGDAWLLHGNPVKHVGNAHGDLVVGNNEELRIAGELL